jgi:hypothetical protein
VEGPWTYAALFAVEDGVADGGVGIAVAPVEAGRGRARRAGRRHAGPPPRRREPPQGPHLPVQRQEEPEVLQRHLPPRRAPPGGGPPAAARARGRGGRRAAGRAEQRVAGDEAAVADDPAARADQHRGRGVTAPAHAHATGNNTPELEVALRRRRGRGRPPHGEERGGVHVDERRPGAAEGMAEVGVGDEVLERRRPRAALRQPPPGEAVAEALLRRTDLHEGLAGVRARARTGYGRRRGGTGSAEEGRARHGQSEDIGARRNVRLLWACGIGRNVHAAPCPSSCRASIFIYPAILFYFYFPFLPPVYYACYRCHGNMDSLSDLSLSCPVKGKKRGLVSGFDVQVAVRGRIFDRYKQTYIHTYKRHDGLYSILFRLRCYPVNFTSSDDSKDRFWP